MKLEFNQGVSREVITWLDTYVGKGNIEYEIRRDPKETDAWYYDRVEIVRESNNHNHDSNISYVPTITVKDPKLALLFVLRWS